MHTLLRLPFILLELALRRLFGVGGGDDARPYAPVEHPDPRHDAEVVAAQEARARRARPRAAAPPASAPAPAPATPPAPAHVTRGDEAVASFGPEDDAGSTVHVQAPWDGYDAHPAAEVIKRVRAGDEATRAVVLLYEQSHKARASVIKAAGGQRTTA